MILKKDGAISIKDFHPISLIGNLCNILSKVLANRLRMVLPEIISDIQGAFADGPQILDIVLNYMTQPWIRDQIIDQSPEGLIKSNDGFQPLRHTHNHETHHN